MAEKKFFLESVNDLQRIGLRAQVVSFLIENGIERGNVVNDQTNKKKVVVAIRFDSNPADNETEIREIEKLKEELLLHLNNLSKSDPGCYGQIPSDIRASRLYDMSNPHIVTTVDLQKLSSSLMLEQTSKGVGAIYSLTEAIKPLSKLPGSIDNLTNKLSASMNSLSANLSTSMDNLSEKIDKMNK